MEILKWYGIIFIGLNMILNIIGIIGSNDIENRVKALIADLLYTPIIIYLILK